MTAGTVPNARGRRPNYSARRTIVELLSHLNGGTLGQLAAATGYSENTIQASILSQLRGFGRVSLTRWNGVYRFTPGTVNTVALAAWLGNGPIQTDTVTPVAVQTPVADNLFRGIPAGIASFYSERAMELDPR